MRKNGKKWEKLDFKKILCSFLVLVLISTQCTQSWGADANGTPTDEIVHEEEVPYKTEDAEESTVLAEDGMENHVSEEGKDTIHEPEETSAEENDIQTDIGTEKTDKENASEPEAEETENDQMQAAISDVQNADEQVQAAVLTDDEENTEEQLVEETGNTRASWSAVTINETNFPDAQFRSIVKKYDANNNNILDVAELQSVTTVELGGTYENRHTVTSLKGIEYFQNLTLLNCGFGNFCLKTVDVSANQKLQYLYAYHNGLEKLNIQGCTELKVLAIQNENALNGELDLSSYTKLEDADLAGNFFTKLVLPKADENGVRHLKLLGANVSSLSYIDFTGYTREQFSNGLRLNAQNLGLLRLNYSNGVFINEERTFASDTKFYSDADMTTILTEFKVVGGKLTVDKTAKTSGTVYFKSEEAFGLSGSLGHDILSVQLGVKAAESLNGINDLSNCFGITANDVQCSQYDDIKAGKPGRYTVKFSSDGMIYEAMLEVVVPIDEAYFPDAEFRKIVESYNTDTTNDEHDQKILGVDELEAVTNINFENILGCTYEKRHHVGNLEGIEYFQNLTYLNCGYGDHSLKTLDVSSNKKLKYLYAFHNGLTSLNISGCTELEHLWLQFENHIGGELNLSNYTKLDDLRIDRISITKIVLPNADENGIRHLRGFACSENQLSYIDFTGYTKEQFTELLNVVNQNLGILKLNDINGTYVCDDKEFANDTLFYSDAGMTNQLTALKVVNGKLTVDHDAKVNDTIYFASEEAYGLSGSFSCMYSKARLEVNEAKALNEVSELANCFCITAEEVACSQYDDIKSGKPGKYAVKLTVSGVIYDAQLEVVVPIDEAYFPDAEFRKIVESYNTDTTNDEHDQKILGVDELEAVTNINFENILGCTYEKRHHVGNLEGIEYFQNLTLLNCGYGNGSLKTLDVSSNKKLKYLYAFHNGLTSLNISGCTELERLWIQFENHFVGELNLSDYTKLEELMVDGLLLTKIVLPNADENGIRHLRSFSCSANQLSYIDFTGYTKEQFAENLNLLIQNLGILKLNDINGTYVCDDKEFANDTLFYSDAEMTNQLTALKVVNGKLTVDHDAKVNDTIYFASEEAYGLSGSFTCMYSNARLEVNAAKVLNGVSELANCFGITAENVACSQYDDIKSGKPGKYDVKLTVSGVVYDAQLEVVVAIDAQNFTDEAFRKIVKTYDLDQDEVLDTAELQKITSIDLGGTAGSRHTVAALKGIEYFTNLTELNCAFGDGSLKAQELSGLKRLKKLKCSENGFTELNVENLTALTLLYCSGNELTKLDLAKNTALTDLICSYNDLTELKINHLAALANLDCAGNHLTSLDISSLSSNLTVDAEGQTIEKTLAFSYDQGLWKNVELSGKEPVRSFHTNGTVFFNYDTASQTAGERKLTEFSVRDGLLTTEKAFEVVDPVYFETTLYASDGAARAGKLSGTFRYEPQFTMMAGTLFFSSAELVNELAKYNVTDASDLKKLPGMLRVTPDLEEIKDAVSVTLISGSFDHLKTGEKGTYEYQMSVGAFEISGSIVVYADHESLAEQLIVIPATIGLQRDFVNGNAQKEESVKIVTAAGEFMTDHSVVKVYTDAKIHLTKGSLSEDRLNVEVYTVSADQTETKYTGSDPLATLDKALVTEQKFKLISEDVSALKSGNYTGTMNFTIQYCEEE